MIINYTLINLSIKYIYKYSHFESLNDLNKSYWNVTEALEVTPTKIYVSNTKKRIQFVFCFTNCLFGDWSLLVGKRFVFMGF